MDDTQKRLEAMENEVRRITDVLRAANIEEQARGIDRNMPIEQQDELVEIFSDKLFDVVWERYLYIFEFFRSQNGWASNNSGGGSDSFAGSLTMATGSSSGNYRSVWYGTEIGETFSHERPIRYRTRVKFTTTTSSVEAHFLTLNDDSVFQGKASATGFKLLSGTFYGVNQAGGTESQVLLKPNIAADTWYELELRYYPRERVDYYIDGVLLGSNSTNMPRSSDNGLNIAEFYIETKTAAARDMVIEFYEFAQERYA